MFSSDLDQIEVPPWTGQRHTHKAFTLSSGKQSYWTRSCQCLEASVPSPNATVGHGYTIVCQFETMPWVWEWKSPRTDAEHKNNAVSKACLGEVAGTLTAEKSCAGPQDKASFTQYTSHGVLEVDTKIISKVPTPQPTFPLYSKLTVVPGGVLSRWGSGPSCAT